MPLEMKWRELYFQNLIYSHSWLLAWYRLWKYFYGLFTNTTELYRLCQNEIQHSDSHADPFIVSCKTIADIERSIVYSKQLMTERHSIEAYDCGLEEITLMILLKKRFRGNGSLEVGEAKILKTALAVIHETHILAHELNLRAATKYDASNKVHEKQLVELWSRFMPQEPLTHRYSDQWRKLGFQGKDPATDFRGMGCLALDDLTFLSSKYPQLSQDILKASHDPISWFSFALVGIHVTQFCLQCLRTRQLQFYMYMHGPKAKTYHTFYCYVFYTFYKYWTSYSGHPPLTIMDFEKTFQQVKLQIRRELAIRKQGMMIAFPQSQKKTKTQ